MPGWGESFLEFINQILMTGESAGLFPKDELDMIVNDMRTVAKRECQDARHLGEPLPAVPG